jgi:hypothetical protein
MLPYQLFFTHTDRDGRPIEDSFWLSKALVILAILESKQIYGKNESAESELSAANALLVQLM